MTRHLCTLIATLRGARPGTILVGASLALCVLAAGCDFPDLAPGPLELQARLDELAVEIDDLVGDGSCEDADGCSATAFGARACGGPESYLVYCADEVDEALLDELVDEFNQLARIQVSRSDSVSICTLVEEPDVGLRDGVCSAVDEED